MACREWDPPLARSRRMPVANRYLPACLLVLAACAPRPPAAPPPSLVVPASPALPVSAPSRSPEPSPAAPAEPALLEALGDLGGRGLELVSLLADGTLRAGAASASVELGDRSSYFWPKQAALTVVTVAAGVRAILLATPVDEEEDPPNRYRLFVPDGATLRLAFDQVIGVYGVVELRFAGDGTASYLEDGWTACERAGHPSEVRRALVLLRFDPQGPTLQEQGRTPGTERQRCSELAG